MRLFGYYVWHTFINQLRKLFKTWVLIFLAVCFLLGALIGGGAVMLEEAAGDAPTEQVQPLPEEEAQEPGPLTLLGITPMALTELIAGGIVLAVFVFQVLGADKNGSRIFLPADVNLLFASPMKPQSVLLFRVTTQMGTMLVASLYLLFQLPNLVLNLGVSIWAALAGIAAWCLTLMVGTLLKILLYTVCSTRPALKSRLRQSVYALLALILGIYLIYWKRSGTHYLVAAVSLFNAPASRYIPFWGWLKGFCMFAMELHIPGMLLSLAAIAAGSAALCWLIWRVKADFYEDAMAKSQETAELLERAQSEKSGLTVVRRKKDRSDRLRRDGMRHGAGANVFFFKAMYNRFRFAHFGVLTKTSETYLLAAVGVAVLCRFVLDAPGLLPMMLTLGGFTFFRAMGNPLEQDTQMDCFLLIPESTWRKLFWSLMGGTANCLLDLLPAVLVGSLVLMENPLNALAWLPLLVSVDFFATTVGAFIALSVPVSAGKVIKQLVQVLFIYFGLLPDIAIMAVGLVFGHPIAAAMGCTAVNAALGLCFFALTPLFLEPGDGKRNAPAAPFAGDLSLAGKHFSRMGLGIFVILAVGTVLQLLLMRLADSCFPAWTAHPWGIWLITFAPLYLGAVPLGLWILKKVPAEPPKRAAMKPGRLAIAAIICIFLMYAGNLIGVILTSLLQLIPGISAANPIISFAVGNSLLPKVLFMVVLAPVIEEYIFRKQLIDRMHVYGGKLAVVTSALMFGLFHGNLSQLFYAFALGLMFGYVYLKTGKLRYSIGLHMFINFLGSVIAPMFLEKIAVTDTMQAPDLSALASMFPWLLGFFGYALALIGFAIAGAVLFFIYRRKAVYAPARLELSKGTRFAVVCRSSGMVLLLIGCLVMIVLSM